ncbi:MAG: hypothetical protein OEO83_15200 [Alphaproteobacteria bacterium]|nr:hypothetical protein [Alphaproteobacteria bacterium]
MANPILAPGEKLHVMTRRQFEGDLRRHFAGTVMGATDHLVRAEGYVYVFNPSACEYRKRADLRTRIFSLTDAGNIVYVLPPETVVERLEYRIVDGRLNVTDGINVFLDINEFGINS